MKKTLIALDGSASAMRAVEYAGSQFAGIGDLQIALVHVLPNLPAIFWDEGHILNDEEKKERQEGGGQVDRRSERRPWNRCFGKATDILTKAGIKAQQLVSQVHHRFDGRRREPAGRGQGQRVPDRAGRADATTR